VGLKHPRTNITAEALEIYHRPSQNKAALPAAEHMRAVCAEKKGVLRKRSKGNVARGREARGEKEGENVTREYQLK